MSPAAASAQWAAVVPAAAAILALIAGAAGWYYLFYSRAARRLAGVEASAANDRRHRLRRANGAALLALGGLFYAGFTINERLHSAAFLIVWAAVFVLLVVVVSLAFVDVRLTAKLRRTLKP